MANAKFNLTVGPIDVLVVNVAYNVRAKRAIHFYLGYQSSKKLTLASPTHRIIFNLFVFIFLSAIYRYGLLKIMFKHILSYTYIHS